MTVKFIPLAQYYEKHGAFLETLLPKAPVAPGQPSLLVDLLAALIPVAKKYRPDLNANQFLDDTLTLLKIETDS